MQEYQAGLFPEGFSPPKGHSTGTSADQILEGHKLKDELFTQLPNNLHNVGEAKQRCRQMILAHDGIAGENGHGSESARKEGQSEEKSFQRKIIRDTV